MTISTVSNKNSSASPVFCPPKAAAHDASSSTLGTSRMNSNICLWRSSRCRKKIASIKPKVFTFDYHDRGSKSSFCLQSSIFSAMPVNVNAASRNQLPRMSSRPRRQRRRYNLRCFSRLCRNLDPDRVLRELERVPLGWRTLHSVPKKQSVTLKTLFLLHHSCPRSLPAVIQMLRITGLLRPTVKQKRGFMWS